MFLSRRLQRNPEFAQGLRDMLPQATGLAAWGLMTGVAMLKSGMSAPQAVLMTLLVYAGSSQLAALPLIVAGAPAWVILATGFCVNLRFVVFSLHLRPYLMHLPRWQRMMHGYLTADISYVLFTTRFQQPGLNSDEHLAREAYLAGVDCLSWLSWVLSSLLGIALAQLVPSEWGLGFAGILCLLGIMSSLASSKMRLLAAAIAGATAVLAFALPLKLNIVLAIVTAVLACMVLEQLRSTRSAGAGR